MDEAPSYMRSLGFEPVGYAQAQGSELRYAFRTPTGTIVYRGVVLASLPGLLGLNPDVALWRRWFPKPGGRIDTAAAAAFCIRECLCKGLVELPPDLAPRPIGRPKKGVAA
jgi:hypothetical protein